MNIIAVDDEEISLDGLTDSIKKVLPNSEIHNFSKAKKALEFIQQNPVDIAFLDIMMSGINGLELGKAIQNKNPRANIIFVTGYNEFANDAFKMLASGYITKPVGAEDIIKQIQNLRYTLSDNNKEYVRVQCFGNFEVFLNNKPVNFYYNKSKELFAYLIDRKGALCTNKEIISNLWEDDFKASYYQNIRRDLLEHLPKNIFEIQKGKIGIIVSQIECDYFNYLNNKENYKVTEYMEQYSWAEERLGELVF